MIGLVVQFIQSAGFSVMIDQPPEVLMTIHRFITDLYHYAWHLSLYSAKTLLNTFCDHPDLYC